MAGGTERYAAGLPWRARRDLTEPERRWLRARFRGAAMRLASIVVTLALSAVAAGLVASEFPRVAMRLEGGLGIWFCAAGVVGTGVALVRGGWVRIPALLGVLYVVGLAAVGALVPELTSRPQLFSRAVFIGIVLLGTGVLVAAVARNGLLLDNLRRVLTDLEAGEVDCFEGTVGSTPPWELRTLLSRGHGPPEGSTMRLDVLPASGLVVRAGGRRCEVWSCVHVAEVAQPLPHALRVELPSGVAPTSSASDLNLQRRSLTAHEQAELDGHIRRLQRGPWLAALAAAGMLTAIAWQWMKGHPGEEHWSVARRLFDPLMLGWYLLTILTIVDFVRRTIAARKLRDDRRLRWVVTVDDGAPGAGMAAPRLEVLPVSQLAWTENASPAGWRTSRH